MSDATAKSPTSSDALELLIKCTSQPDFTINIDNGADVSELKTMISEKQNLPVERQRLIFSGRIMKDGMSLKELNIQSGNSIHLIKRSPSKQSQQPAGQAAAASVPSTSEISAGQETGNVLSDLTGARYSGIANLPPASIFGPDGGLGPSPDAAQIEQMLENPTQLSEVLDYISTIDENDPMLSMIPQETRQGFLNMARDPTFRSIVTDPNNADILRNAVHPDQNIDTSEINEISRLLQGTGAGSQQPSFLSQSSAEIQRLQELLGLPSPGGAQPTDAQTRGLLEALAPQAGAGADANESARNLFSQMFAAAPPSNPSRPPEELYETQLGQLNELGFFDFDRNVKALRRSGGNIEGAIEALVENLV